MMSNSKGWLQLGLIYYLRLKRKKGILGFWASEVSYGKVTGKGMVNKSCSV